MDPWGLFDINTPLHPGSTGLTNRTSVDKGSTLNKTTSYNIMITIFTSALFDFKSDNFLNILTYQYWHNVAFWFEQGSDETEVHVKDLVLKCLHYSG